MLSGTETWPTKREKESALSTADRRMVREISGMKLSDKVGCIKMRERLGLEDTMAVLQRNRLQWYGYDVL